MKKLFDRIKNKSRFNYKQYFKTNILFFTFVISSVINATMLRYLTVRNYFDFRPIIADLAIVLLIGAFGYFFKPKHQFKYFFSISILFTAVCVINSMYYTNYLSYASVSLLATSMQIVDVGDAIVENVMELKDFSYIWQIFVMYFVHVTLKSKSYYVEVTKTENGKKNFKGTILSGLIFALVFIVTLTATDIGRLGKQWNREYIVMRYGIYVYQINDIIGNLSPTINSMFGYDRNAKIFREYYEENPLEVTNNQYTDIFKGKNVIAIHAESIQQFTLGLSFNDKELTPTLNKLASEGIYFSNFYAQESVGTSSDSEFIFNTGLMPASSGTVAINYFDREYITIQKLLKNQGYYTFSMHGNNGTFWNRNLLHESFGYDNFYYHTKDYVIDETIGLGLSDKSFFLQSIPKIKTISESNKNFYGTLIMLTNHTPFSYIEPYSDYSVDLEIETVNPKTGKKKVEIKPYLEGTVLGNYLKSVHYADEAIGELIEGLDEEGILDNTVIIIYGDHDAKIKPSEYEYFYNYNPETGEMLDKNDPNYHEVDAYEYELNRKVPFIIWAKDQEFSTEVTEVMGMYDVLPTLGNMMGFHSEYSLGHDIFSVEENLVVFPEGNWLTNKMYYNSQRQEGLLLDLDIPVSVDYIEKNCEIAEEYISVSNAIITYDLIRKTKESSHLLKTYK
ncbi:MAG: LTA synthase family protein [Firmicutes bacterium]|nr:LTA synthase family protein [Bacillota bacterium]